MKNRFISILIIVSLILAFLPSAAFAEETDGAELPQLDESAEEAGIAKEEQSEPDEAATAEKEQTAEPAEVIAAAEQEEISADAEEEPTEETAVLEEEAADEPEAEEALSEEAVAEEIFEDGAEADIMQLSYTGELISGDYKYLVNRDENTAVITEYTGSAKSLTIPSTLGGIRFWKFGD